MPEADSTWIPDEEWARIQQLVPIACVDVLPVRPITGGVEIGLILRDTPVGQRWCLVGGRIRLNESIREAVLRQLTSTLGDGVQCSLTKRLHPDHVAEYFSDRRDGELQDPRQHAIGLTYIVVVAGVLQARGEAIGFRWFTPDALPPTGDFGFGQRSVVEALLERL